MGDQHLDVFQRNLELVMLVIVGAFEVVGKADEEASAALVVHAAVADFLQVMSERA